VQRWLSCGGEIMTIRNQKQITQNRMRPLRLQIL
jgi:hypothetical protein